MTENTTATTLPLTCLEAVSRLCKAKKRTQRSIAAKYKQFMKAPLLETLRNDFYYAFQILRECNVPILIMAKKRNKTQIRHSLLIDIRHLPEITAAGGCLYWILDADTGELVFQTQNKTKMPHLTCHKTLYRGMKTQLSEILQLPVGLEREPQSLDELTKLVDSHNMAAVTCITYMISVSPLQTYTWYKGRDRTSLVAPFMAHAYTKSNLDIGYCFSRTAAAAGQRKQRQMPVIEKETAPKIPEPNSPNLRTSVSVNVKGLRLAVALGLISQEQMQALSCELAATAGALWITCDDEKHARYISYKDQGVALNVKIDCRSVATDNVWLTLLKRINKRAAQLRQKRVDILYPLLQRLESFRGSKLISPWTACLQQLKLAIYVQKVFLFCTDDTLLHLIKVPFAGFLTQPNSKGAFVHTVCKNNIGALSGQGLQFINLCYYFNYGLKVYAPEKDDEVLWAVCQDWLPADGSDSNTPWLNPDLLHKRSSIKHYPKILDTPMGTFLRQRGQRNAQAVLDLYRQFVAFNATTFGYDVSTVGHISLSKLAFDIVWLDYAKQAGPMAHSIEKVHPHVEYLLRPWCKGGFSFSCRDYLESGHPLEEGKDDASSIREYDLSSAYGASASTMATAKGFGLVYKEDMVSQRRWDSFEYRAVMYTLYKWMYVDKKNITSVFSNYSPLGLLQIGKYPIDLVAIMDDGSVEMVQFDGHFVHGDYNNPDCPTLPCYVGGATRRECEAKTKQRDQETIDWMVNVQGHKISYRVITDCCHPSYTSSALTRAFNTIPDLVRLNEGIKTIKGKSLDQVNLATTTFVAQVTGRATRPPNGPIGPVFNQDWTCFQDAFKSSGTMLLTGDYYQYLRQFGFEVDEVEWVVFYQRCFDLPRVMNRLVDMRTRSGPAKNAFVKSLINMACGYFGLNSNKGPRSMVRVTHRLPKNHSVFKHHITSLADFKEKPIHLVTTLMGKGSASPTCMPLPLFVNIIEYGKLMLNRALLCLQKHLDPKAFRLLYCNVDNMIIASSEEDLADATLDSSIFGYMDFKQDFERLTGDGPGLLKQEWCITKPWKFVSPGLMHYCINTPTSTFGKSCVIKGVSPLESFAIAMDLHNNVNVTVNQTLTINKLAGPETRIVQYKF